MTAASNDNGGDNQGVRDGAGKDNDGSPHATLVTTLGTIVIQLLPEAAPKTVANFVNLANSGFYNNLAWHRVVRGFVIQTGDPKTKNGEGNPSLWGTGGGPVTVPLEVNPRFHHSEASVGLARSSDPNSGSSQFYVNLVDNSRMLDGQYTVFGNVIRGMDVARALGEVPVRPGDRPVNNVFLVSVTIKRGDPGETTE